MDLYTTKRIHSAQLDSYTLPYSHSAPDLTRRRPCLPLSVSLHCFKTASLLDHTKSQLRHCDCIIPAIPLDAASSLSIPLRSYPTATAANDYPEHLPNESKSLNGRIHNSILQNCADQKTKLTLMTNVGSTSRSNLLTPPRSVLESHEQSSVDTSGLIGKKEILLSSGCHHTKTSQKMHDCILGSTY
ncbi:hypothetical protein Tco_0277984 [Tanacetum coccineum]